MAYRSRKKFTPTKKQTLKIRSKKSYSSSKKLARLQPSLKRYVKNKSVYSAMKTFAESRMISCSRYNELAPLSCQGAGNFLYAYWNGFVLGDLIPTGWGAGWNTLSGISTTRGDDPTQRQGAYMYLNKTHITMDIEMLGNPQGEYPIQEFRVILFKERSTIPTGDNPSPQSRLFLNEVGQPFGHTTSVLSHTPRDLMIQPLNKRQFVVLKDIKFKLRDGGWNADGKGDLKSHKRIILNLPHNIKARYAYLVDGLTPTEPTNYNYRYGIIVYSRVIGAPAQSADRHRVSLRGATSAMDS